MLGRNIIRKVCAPVEDTKPTFWITTSWDDGHRLDLRVAEYLQKHRLSGTFYVTRDYPSEQLTHADIRALSDQFEVGAHSLTHPKLTQVPLSKAKEEIAGSQAWLESVIGAPVKAFCYPKGAYNAEVRALVAEAGFTVARTINQFRLDCGNDFMELPTTLQFYPFLPRLGKHVRIAPVRLILPHMLRLRISPADLRNWSALALALLKRAAATGGVWHLWGHSWAIEKHQMWSELDNVLSIASSYPGARVVTNSQLVSLATTQINPPMKSA